MLAPLLAGIMFGIVFGELLSKFDVEKFHNKCPFCKSETDILVKKVYECTNCGKRFTDDEGFAKDSDNQEEEIRAQEEASERFRREERKAEFKEKLNDLKDEYRDVR